LSELYQFSLSHLLYTFGRAPLGSQEDVRVSERTTAKQKAFDAYIRRPKYS